MKFNPHPYQEHGIDHVLQNPYCGLFLDMGLGKTAVTLTAINRLMFEEFETSKVLVIAPKKVAEDTWARESQKWDHLKHLRLSIILGTERQRIEALRAKADIYIINRENVDWLVTHLGGAWPFDTVVIDELSSFKNPSAVRFKAMRTVRPKMKRVIGLTGTPAPNGLEDLWAQLYLLDQGERLGKTITGYRTQYFTKTPYVNYPDYKLKQASCEQQIYSKIEDICVSMKAKDYLQLPKRIDRVKVVKLPAKTMQSYLAFEKDLILSMPDVEEITAVNAAALSTKLLQFSNGAIYDSESNWHEVHREKLEALEEEIEAANGNPVLCFYSYKHDLERILKYFKALKPVVLKGSAEVERWNKGEIRLLLAHPASAGHGLNMQDGGHVLVWFGLQWGLELYQQAVARLDRQGQTKPVINSRIVCEGTIDEEVLTSLQDKAVRQDALLAAIKARIKKYQKL